MSNSNCSIGLQRLKPVHTAYCGLHNLAENWSWARDVNGRDRDVETETTTLASAGTSAKEVNVTSSDELLLFFYLSVHQTLAVSAHRGLCNIYYVTAPTRRWVYDASLTYQCLDWTRQRVDKTGHCVDNTGHYVDMTGLNWILRGRDWMAWT